MIYYVSANGHRSGDGTKERPFMTISQAAQIAKAGDEVVVAPGIYREYVDPQNAGTEEARIVYRSEKPLAAVITGAEPVKNWEKYQGDVWVARIPNGIFGGYNPYTTLLSGDWYYSQIPFHTGEVYLNGKSMYETNTLEGVLDPKIYEPSWDKAFTLHQWYTCQEDGNTVIYANFQGVNPNENNVEINVRRNCFYPSKEGVGYITLSGFTVKQAATTWAPPTAYQEGMVGPHWSKGWIIEDCEISDSKCCGISLGKYLQPNNENKWTLKRLKNGTQTERDAICQAQYEGWTKERIGSHIVRRCHIHDCEQAGIVGHLGCVFSIIEDCHIHHINNKQQLLGAEIGGTKLHAAIDVIFRRNHVHNCTRGLWLDWQAQGTRVTQNLFHDNMPPADVKVALAGRPIGEDLFIEVSHGPTLVDHNIFLSPYACRLATQGTAFIHNLICGSYTCVGKGTNNGVGGGSDQVRYTPYHVPHRTEVAGFMTFLHGDDRFYNNIFVQRTPVGAHDELFRSNDKEIPYSAVGLDQFDDYPTLDEYMAKFFVEGDEGAAENRAKYYDHMPVYIDGNVYFNGAKPWAREQNYVADTEHQIKIDIVEKDGAYYLDTNIAQYVPKFATPFISTEMLGEAFEPEEKFENPDGTPIFFDKDYKGVKRGVNPTAGPFENQEEWGEKLN